MHSRTNPTTGTEIMRTAKLITACVVTLVTVAGRASAQTPVDRTVATPATGAVQVHNISGSVEVMGWDRNEVRVTGTLGEGTDRLDIATSGDRVVLRVIIPEGRRNVEGSDLVVRVPSRKTLVVRTVSADVEVAGVVGDVDAESTSGRVVVSGSPRAVRAASVSGNVQVEANTGKVIASSTSGNVEVSGSARDGISAETVSGHVQVSAPSPDVAAKSVSGNVSITGAVQRIAATTVSGGVEARSARLQYGSFESVSGGLSFEGQVTEDAALSLVSHSGDVHVGLPQGVGARFEVITFSGSIRNALGPAPQRVSRYGPGQELEFTSGNGGAVVRIKSFSGSVTIGR
jgi:DUF4097 and DUF4098 domain-containing protein YvlB